MQRNRIANMNETVINRFPTSCTKRMFQDSFGNKVTTRENSEAVNRNRLKSTSLFKYHQITIAKAFKWESSRSQSTQRSLRSLAIDLLVDEFAGLQYMLH
jgi:hypothetical protein